METEFTKENYIKGLIQQNQTKIWQNEINAGYLKLKPTETKKERAELDLKIDAQIFANKELEALNAYLKSL